MLKIKQRLNRLEARIAELNYWLVRDVINLQHWQCRHGRGEWKPLELGEEWCKPSTEDSDWPLWYLSHGVVEVPEDWKLEDVKLELSLGGEGLLFLDYQDLNSISSLQSKQQTDQSDQSEEQNLEKKPVTESENTSNVLLTSKYSHDPNHQRYPITKRCFSIRAECVARQPFGVPNHNPTLAKARLLYWETELETYIRLLTLIAETVAVLAEHQAATELLSIAEQGLAMFKVPSQTTAYLERTYHSQAMQEIWQRPAEIEDPELASVYPNPFTLLERVKVSEATAHMQQALRTLQLRYPPQGALHLSGHAHIDIAWLWPLDETRRKVQRTLSNAVDLLERYPDTTFNQSSAQIYNFLRHDDPELFARVQEHITAGQFEPVGGMWVESDCNMPTGESLVRQLLYGQRYLQRHLGCISKVCWLPDSFGFSPALPQLLKSAGIESFFTMKLNWSETNDFPYDLFYWEGLDGSTVLAHLFDNPVGGYNGELGPEATWHTWQNYQQKHHFPKSLLTLGFGDGGGGLTEEMLERYKLMKDLPILPKLEFGKVNDYFEEAAELTKPQEKKMPQSPLLQSKGLPCWRGELYLELHRGTLTTQGRIKKLHRQAEQTLVATEIISSFTYLVIGDASEDDVFSLESLWRVLLRNQFHDILPGSSIREVYVRAENELANVISACERYAAIQRERLRQHLIAEGKHKGLFVINLLNSSRPLRLNLDEPHADAQPTEDGYVITRPTPLMAFSVNVILNGNKPVPMTVSTKHLENTYLRVELSEDGTIEQIYDLRANRRPILRDRGNQLWAYVDKPRAWDAWDVDADYAQEGEEIINVISMEVIEKGPHRIAVRIVRRFGHSTITQDVRLWANSHRLEFHTTLDWHDRHWLLKAHFPLEIHTEYATFETAFGVVKRPTHSNTSWQQAQFEVPAHRFVDVSEELYGVALLNDGRYGYHVQGNDLGISLLRSPTYPDPLADEGLQSFTYALYPHKGSWLEGGVLREVEDLNMPLVADIVNIDFETSMQLIELKGVPITLATLKTTEDETDDGLVMRFYEPQGARGQVNLRLPSTWEVDTELDILEQPIGRPAYHFSPFQVRSWHLKKKKKS